MRKIVLGLLTMVGLGIAMEKMTEHYVAYPEDYRLWTHLKSMVINDVHHLANPFEGIHHVYANEKATEGLTKKSYEEGATFVFDLLEANRTKEATTEGGRKFIGVMTYDSKKFAKTGNWGFEAFAGDSQTERVVKDAGVSCFACHQAVQQESFVFSKFRK